MRYRYLFLIYCVLSVCSGSPQAATYFIATDGSDDQSGTIEEPFGTFDHAIRIAEAGDTIFVRGGKYTLSHGIEISNAGAEGRPINLWAHQAENPLLDFATNPRHSNPPQPRMNDAIAATKSAVGIHVSGGGDWWHIKGLTIENAPYYGVRVYGSNNVFEELVLRGNKASGLEITGKSGCTPSNNLVLNCDSYFNFDPQSNGEDADGFGAKFDGLGPGNVFRGLRAWSNADDGYDFWHAAHPVLVEDCWAFDNGFFRPEWTMQVSGSWQGDGMGFKLGQDAAELVLNRIVAFGNKGYGIDENGNRSQRGVTINHATMVNNTTNGNAVQVQLNDGSPHTIRNSIAFDSDGPVTTEFSEVVNDSSNTWNGVGVTARDFVDIRADRLLAAATGPRQADGSLPDIGLHLAPSSALIDAGTDDGQPYDGKAPDLGAFENRR
tara:strand:+ start:7505 stop:8812 length:1308 start_codon:yes stop_codon:yes gene_type:complete